MRGGLGGFAGTPMTKPRVNPEELKKLEAKESKGGKKRGAK
jgi:hypothetical protein